MSLTDPLGAAENVPTDDFVDMPTLEDNDNDFTDLPALVDESDDEDELCDDELEHLTHEERVQLALTAIRTSVMSQRKACLYYRVTRGTVQNRAKGIPTRTEGHAHERKVSEAKESILKEWVKVLGARGMPLSLQTIADYATELAGEDVGVNWAKGFKERHPDLKVKWTTGLEECRARSLT
ncbi:hypothetical protein DFH07DRAFT_783913 [Mycena maculata]|uniref:HTH CENPB-type domain-containing protein n=1 Tax=Mycena maculata TaxID=230809 RepID=A0AAD7MKV8_9AGAR|nr:hypothetical protein DFH07DRAFT_783913 [Mycena maculata]